MIAPDPKVHIVLQESKWKESGKKVVAVYQDSHKASQAANEFSRVNVNSFQYVETFPVIK